MRPIFFGVNLSSVIDYLLYFLSDDGMMELMKKLPPTGIDSEIRSLAPEHGGSLEGLQHFMEFMLSQLKKHVNFELIEAYLGLFLKVCTSISMCVNLIVSNHSCIQV